MGFIGASLAIELSKLKYNITLYDLRSDNKEDKIYLQYPNISFIQGDTNNTELLVKTFNNNAFDGVIHLAAVSRVVIAQNNPNECVKTNIKGTKSLLESIKQSNIKTKPWIMFGSSREVYGEPKEMPVKESFEKKFVNIYGDSKIQGEELFISFAKENDCSCLILRFSNVYGNKYDLLDRVVPRFIKGIYNNEALIIEGGNQIIDFTHIDDTVDTILKAINHIEHNNIIDDFHILPGVGWSLYQAIEYMETFLNKKAVLKINHKRNYDVEKFIGDTTKIRNILKSRNFLSLKDGLKRAIPKYLQAIK